MIGSPTERKALVDHLKTVWDTSPPEHSEECMITYCGLEIASTSQGMHP